MPMKRKYWEIVQAMPAEQLAPLIRRFEELDLDGVWVPQLHAPPFPTMAAIAMVSQRLKIGSGIALAFTRSPLETALSALDIDRLSGGRVVLGLGTSVRMFNERNHGVVYGKPVAHLREVVSAVRAIIEEGNSGNRGAMEGGYYKLDPRGFMTLRNPGRPSIPIFVPALFENTVALAAKSADGLLGHPVWSLRWTGEMARKLETDLASAQRTRSDVHLNL